MDFQFVSDTVFKTALEENKKLLQVAKPIMDSVYKILLNSTSSLSLASSSGIILYGRWVFPSTAKKKHSAVKNIWEHPTLPPA